MMPATALVFVLLDDERREALDRERSRRRATARVRRAATRSRTGSSS
jgi:hypothetical protein